MNEKEILQSQYLASLKMLDQITSQCPDALWNDRSYRNVFWQVVYHTLFYAHLYVQSRQEDFIPWAKDREEVHRLNCECAPYSRAEIAEYAQLVQQQIIQQMASSDLDAPSGFPWLPFNKLETHIYSIRHIQQHIGELSERLGGVGQIDIQWISQVR